MSKSNNEKKMSLAERYEEMYDVLDDLLSTVKGIWWFLLFLLLTECSKMV